MGHNVHTYFTIFTISIHLDTANSWNMYKSIIPPRAIIIKNREEKTHMDYLIIIFLYCFYKKKVERDIEREKEREHQWEKGMVLLINLDKTKQSQT